MGLFVTPGVARVLGPSSWVHVQGPWAGAGVCFSWRIQVHSTWLPGAAALPLALLESAGGAGGCEWRSSLLWDMSTRLVSVKCLAHLSSLASVDRLCRCTSSGGLLLLLSQFTSVAQSCPTLCDPADCSTPGFPVHHQLREFTQTHVHWVGDAIQPSHPLSSPSPPAFNLSQPQSLFKWVSSSHQVAKVLEFQLQHQSFQRIFRTDFL